MAIDWLNMGNPLGGMSGPNALTGETGDTITGPSLALMALQFPEQAAALLAAQGIRPGRPMQTPQAPIDPANVTPGMPGMTAAIPDIPVAPGAGQPGMNTQSGAKITGGPAGLLGIPGVGDKMKGAANALAHVRPVASPNVPIVPAPRAPEVRAPAAYNPQMLQMLMQMMQSGGAAPMPSLAQLMGR